MKTLTETHPHRALANLLNSQANDADLLNLSASVARFLEKEWSVPINSAEVQFAIREWTKANRSPDISKLSLPSHEATDWEEGFPRFFTDAEKAAPASRNQAIIRGPRHCGRCLSTFVEDCGGGRLHCLDCSETWTPGVEHE